MVDVGTDGAATEKSLSKNIDSSDVVLGGRTPDKNRYEDVGRLDAVLDGRTRKKEHGEVKSWIMWSS